MAGLGFVQRCFSPGGAFWHTAVHAMYSSGFLPVSSFVFHLSLLTVKNIDLVVAHDGFLCVTKIVCIFFMVTTLITEVLFK